MKKYLAIKWLWFLVLLTISCTSKFSHLNLDVSNPYRNSIIELPIPDAQSNDRLWQQFFEISEASKVWKILRLKRDILDIQFKEIDNPSAEKCNKIVEAAIYYLIHRRIDIKQLNFVGIKGRPDVNLTIIPSILTRLSSLEKLYLSYNQIEAFPADLGKLTKLKLLDLSYNQVVEIPAGVFTIPNLEILHLSFNQINTIPSHISNLKSLQVLVLRNNQITQLPEISNLIGLRNLDLSNNKFKIFPIQIIELGNLESLSLSFNYLEELPTEIAKLLSLKIIQLDHNQLEEVASDLFNLPKLRALELGYNQLTKLPASVSRHIMSKKEKILLSNNPWIQNGEKTLKQLTPEEVLKCSNPFPHSLCALCAKYIEEEYLTSINIKDIECILPEELQQPQRKKLLQKAYQWADGKNILFFKLVGNIHIPFYLDPILNSYDAIKNMFEEFSAETFYKLEDSIDGRNKKSRINYTN